jgi:hypothetical protein
MLMVMLLGKCACLVVIQPALSEVPSGFGMMRQGA